MGLQEPCEDVAALVQQAFQSHGSFAKIVKPSETGSSEVSWQSGWAPCMLDLCSFLEELLFKLKASEFYNLIVTATKARKTPVEVLTTYEGLKQRYADMKETLSKHWKNTALSPAQHCLAGSSVQSEVSEQDTMEVAQGGSKAKETEQNPLRAAMLKDMPADKVDGWMEAVHRLFRATVTIIVESDGASTKEALKATPAAKLKGTPGSSYVGIILREPVGTFFEIAH